ncbi:MAG TPA: thiamine phosphate synthase [Granulicella sp.]|jgi:thiamine-phosphate pyrophosphorylase|nr:thiamine phosphate synthase [Granulicella sp.]
MNRFPKLYPIIDAETLRLRGVSLLQMASSLKVAGVRLLQYRDKTGDDRTILKHAEMLVELFEGTGAKLIMNDRADLMMLARWDGVHLGQEDLSPEDARIVIGDGRLIGVSTHTDEQVRVAEATRADYVAIGPVFATGTKANAAPVVGLEGVRRARALTTKPLVAIGGITRANARSVIEAGADSVAVIGGLFGDGEPVERVVEDFMGILG